ncbi:MAG: DUF1559 domain-containing protein [Candidatus Hydrogenedentes bacterium]|nr:DUF1559 domain-containing protein [Candidatus Hydrogenedentota bacterium]
MLAAILLPALARAREAARRASCANNLKQMGLVFKMYANESKGQKFPPCIALTCDKTGTLTTSPSFQAAADATTYYPEYLSDLNVLVCPSDSEADMSAWHLNDDLNDIVLPCRVDAKSYNYYSFAIMKKDLMGVGIDENDPGITELSDAYYNPNFLAGLGEFITAIGNGNLNRLDEDVTYGDGVLTIYRLREGIERFFITDINNPASSALAQSEVWIQSDDMQSVNPDMMNHVPGGCNVLYMDGHVEFIKYPGETPSSRAWAVFNSYASSYGS